MDGDFTSSGLNSNGLVSDCHHPHYNTKLTRRKVPARVRDRLLAIEHSVGLHLVRGSRRQLLQVVGQRVVVDVHRAVRSRIGEADDLQLERRVIAERGWTPVDLDCLAGADSYRQIGRWIRS